MVNLKPQKPGRAQRGRRAKMIGLLSLPHSRRDPVRDQRGRHLPEPQEHHHLLMAIELMLLAVNMNFIAFSHYLDDIAGRSSCSSS
jgi:hypothetical protein